MLFVLLHVSCVPFLHVTFVIGVDEEGRQFGMAGQNLTCFVHTEYHECSGIGIGCGTVSCKDCGGQNAVLDGVSGMGVYGMGVLPVAFFIVVAVVAGCCHREVGDVEYLLQVGLAAGGVVNRFNYTYAPFPCTGIKASDAHFSSDFYHIVGYTLTFKVFSYGIDSVAFGYGTAVEHCKTVGLDDM